MVLGKCALMREPPVACREPLQRAMAIARAARDDLCAMHAGQALAFSHMFQEDYEPALRQFGEVLPIVERTAHPEFLGNHWGAVGWARYTTGDLAGAREALERAIAATRTVGDAVTEAGVTAYAACVDVAAGDPARALDRLLPVYGRALEHGAGFLLPWAEVAIALAHAADGRLHDARAAFQPLLAGGVPYVKAWAHAGLAETLRLVGEAGEAATAARRALELAGRLGNRWLAACARLVLGRLAAADGRWSDAERLHHDALESIAAGGYRLDLPRALEALAEVAAGLESHVEAARLLGAAGRVREELGLIAWTHQRAELEALASRLRGADGAFEDGAGLTSDEAVAWVRRTRGRRRRPPGGWESLTPTELEVVRHAAAGLSNPQIGERMFISRATVKTHLAHVYAKLGLRNRAELAREVAVRR